MDNEISKIQLLDLEISPPGDANFVLEAFMRFRRLLWPPEHGLKWLRQ